MDRERSAASGVSVRLAYLCNLYPAISHSFVRREIKGIERAGHEVHRFSLRPARDDLRDEGDLREVTRTESVLSQGALRLSTAALICTLTRPIKTLASASMAFRLA